MTAPLFNPVVICGPTASGKTALAMELAARIDGEIISADSMQVYRGMDIGTAKPSAKERNQVLFHLIDVADPDCQFTAADWKKGALEAMDSIRSRHRMPILCGGTGMYLRALLRNWTMADTPRDARLRKNLEDEAATLGSTELYRRLQKLDPETARRLHPNDALRIVRALEVCVVSGSPLSALHAKDREVRARTPVIQAQQFALMMPREMLYRRIDERVDGMIALGLEDEARSLLTDGYSDQLPALNSLGYKEIFAYLRGEATRETAVEQIKMNTRRYAKRQVTWFRSEPEITWVDTSIVSSAEVVNRIASAILPVTI